MMTNPAGRITQGQFGCLPDLTGDEIRFQIECGLHEDDARSVECSDDPHPRNTYWEMFGMPMFDPNDAAGVMMQMKHCRETFPNHNMRLMVFDATGGIESIAMSFVVDHPHSGPAFGRVRPAADDPRIRCTVHSYAADEPVGERFGG